MNGKQAFTRAFGSAIILSVAVGIFLYARNVTITPYVAGRILATCVTPVILTGLMAQLSKNGWGWFSHISALTIMAGIVFAVSSIQPKQQQTKESKEQDLKDRKQLVGNWRLKKAYEQGREVNILFMLKEDQTIRSKAIIGVAGNFRQHLLSGTWDVNAGNLKITYTQSDQPGMENLNVDGVIKDLNDKSFTYTDGQGEEVWLRTTDVIE